VAIETHGNYLTSEEKGGPNEGEIPNQQKEKSNRRKQSIKRMATNLAFRNSWRPTTKKTKQNKITTNK